MISICCIYLLLPLQKGHLHFGHCGHAGWRFQWVLPKKFEIITICFTGSGGCTSRAIFYQTKLDVRDFIQVDAFSHINAFLEFQFYNIK